MVTAFEAHTGLLKWKFSSGVPPVCNGLCCAYDAKLGSLVYAIAREVYVTVYPSFCTLLLASAGVYV